MAIIAIRDSHWEEILGLCRRYGFITQAFGEAATISTNRHQLESWNEPTYRFRQEKMFGSFPLSEEI